MKCNKLKLFLPRDQWHGNEEEMAVVVVVLKERGGFLLPLLP